jgi:cysteine-rich repeat protein
VSIPPDHRAKRGRLVLHRLASPPALFGFLLMSRRVRSAPSLLPKPSLVALTLMLVACDGTTPPVDGGEGLDGGALPLDCVGQPLGTSCGTSLVCVDGACVQTRCGDGFVDTTSDEQCEDGNGIAFDGCEPESCRFTCADDAECDDARPCNGGETCDAALHTCVAGAPLTAGTECAQPDGSDGVCRSEACVAAGCGNGVPDGDEECDDGNDDQADGCENDCTFSCEADGDCDDGDPCTGAETCDEATHVCEAGEALACADESPCTTDTCEPGSGCRFTLIDIDGDGHAARGLGSCGDDCDDARDDVYPGATEQCDSIDHDCDGSPTPIGTPLWYRDCDDDGYAFGGATPVEVCEEPPPPSCGGGWTTRTPDTASADCYDANASVRPNQFMYFTTPISGVPASINYDYDCSGTEEMRWTSAGVSTSAGCAVSAGRCSGAEGWTSAGPPACGTDGTWTACAGAGCSRTSVVRRQSCR